MTGRSWRGSAFGGVRGRTQLPQFVDRFPEGALKLAGWLLEGRLRHAETVVDGLENTFDTFLQLFDGRSRGRLIVRIAEE